MSDIMLNPGSTHAGAQPLTVLTPPGTNTPGKDKVIFHCAVPAASMYRKDGKKLAFVFNFHETDIVEDIAFLDAEIANGVPFLSRATYEQMQNYRQRTNPRKLMEDEVRQSLEPVLRAKLEAEIRAELLAELQGGDASKIAGTETVNTRLAKLKTETATITTAPGNPANAKFSPVSSRDLAGSADSNSK